MIVGSIKENLTIEKRVSITPETAKNIINLGLKVFIENDYATHIGITDEIAFVTDIKGVCKEGVTLHTT
jgi:alanine dehydrogenase